MRTDRVQPLTVVLTNYYQNQAQNQWNKALVKTRPCQVVHFPREAWSDLGGEMST